MTSYDNPLKLALRVFGGTIRPENQSFRTQGKLLREFDPNF